jgi:hypothetical protein
VSGSELVAYWIAVLGVCSFGAFMWWRSRNAAYVESRSPGVYKAFLIGYRQQPAWIAPSLVALGIVGMAAATVLEWTS